MITGLYGLAVERSASRQHVNTAKSAVSVKRCGSIDCYHIEFEHICDPGVDNMIYGISLHLLAYRLDTVIGQRSLKARPLVLGRSTLALLSRFVLVADF